MKVYLGSDHAGFELKSILIPYLQELGYETVDVGPYEYNPSDDYPDCISKVAFHISESPHEAMGIVIGGSGQGEAMVANKFKRVRAVVYNGQYEPKDGRIVPDEIKTSREHNDANILSLGARFLNHAEAKDAVKRWLETPFSNEERHKRRLEKIEAIESIAL